jgi:hypothetical protein
MKQFKLKISAHLCESEPGEHDAYDSYIAGENHVRIIDGELRLKLSHDELKELISRELRFGTDWLNRQMLDKIQLPLTKTVKNQIDEIQNDLHKLIPNWRLSVLVSDGVFRIYAVCSQPFVGEITDIFHPLNPNQYLTTKYSGMRDKLSDGTWTYGYQCHNCYEGVVERLEAPFDETVVADYFKNKGLKYKISCVDILPLPEVCVKNETHDWDD